MLKIAICILNIYLVIIVCITSAITGNGFCTSAKRAFRKVVGNALRLAAINSVGDFTIFLGKLAPVSIVAIVGLELLAVSVFISG